MIWNEKRIAILAALCVSITYFAAGQEARTPAAGKTAQAEKLTSFRAQTFGQAAISPDGKRVAWVETRADTEGTPTGKKDIYTADASGSGKATRLTAGMATAHYDEEDLAWSPDSKRIAFLSDAAKAGQLELYVSGAGPAPTKKLTSVEGFLAAPKW